MTIKTDIYRENSRNNVLSYFRVNYLIICRCGGGVCVVIGKVRVYGLELSDFEPQSCYYVHFLTNTSGKGMNPLFHLQLWLK